MILSKRHHIFSLIFKIGLMLRNETEYEFLRRLDASLSTAFLDEIGVKILFHLRKKKMNQAELSRITGVSTASISQYVNGKREPCLRNLVMICNVLEVSTDEILGLNQEAQNEYL